MKTSVVLLALATAAIAAPALHEEAFEGEHHVPVDFLDAVTRERKSTQDTGASSSPGSPANLPSSQISEFGVSGRSFNLKKPIIIKKRVGSSYQVYRDSDEEKLDSPEPCSKQVKVKLCDHTEAQSEDMMKSSNIEDANLLMNEDDMKHSIKLAKEAVENVQKDLRNIEHKSGQSSSWKHGDSESDVELHKDIEVARQALEHIHHKFGISETPSVPDMTLKEAEVQEDIAMAQNTEERLVQWKEAIENIQKNVEIVRNIEDSFKSTDHDDLTHINEAFTSTKGTNEKEPNKLMPKEEMRFIENFETKAEHKPIVENLTKHEKSSEHNDMKTEHDGKDMLESASTVSASKLQELNQNDKARLMSELKSEHFTKTRDAFHTQRDVKQAIEAENIHNIPQNMNVMTLKTVEDDKERKTATSENKHLEKEDKLDKEPLMKMKSMDSRKLLELQRNAAEELHGSSTHLALKHEEKTESIAKQAMEDKKITKSFGNFAEKNSESMEGGDKKHKEEHTMAQMKEAALVQPTELKKDTLLFAEMKTDEDMMHKEHSLTEGKKAFDGNSMTPALTSKFLDLNQHKVMEPTFEMKAAEDTKDMHHQLIDHPHMRWSSDKNFNSEMGLMKSAAEIHQGQMNKMHPGHHHVHQHARPHHLDTSSHARLHDHFMTHAKSADMDNAMQSNYFMNMRESDVGQEGHGFRWRPSQQHMHESARTAYGASAIPTSAPTSGAVGLFPNANVGGCGIPLLLSCNPSVVSGSLAKAHPASYSAPAYRTEDDFNFHSKRDVKKTETLANTLNSKPTNQHLKTSPIFVSKQ